MVGSAAIKQGRSANRKHTYFFFGLIIFLPLYENFGCIGRGLVLWATPVLV